MINLLDNAPNQPIRFRAENWVEINGYSRERITLIVKLNLNFNVKITFM